MVLRAGLEPARIAPHAPQTCAATNYATSAIFKNRRNYLLAGAVAFAFAAGAEFVEAFALFANEFVAGVSISAPFASGAVFASVGGTPWSAAGCSAGCSAGISPAELRTEILPLNTGIEIINADSMNSIAAVMVSFESTEAVPRGPNAALETLLVNNAPASVLPGCNKTAATSTMHEIKNTVYRTYNNLLTYL